MKSNLINWITDDLEEGELVESVVIGEMGWGNYGSERVPRYSEQPKGVVLSWEDAKPWIDYEFDNGYGSPECNAINVWTNKRVFWVTQYDGSTSLSSAPRHPTNGLPSMPGG